MGRVELFWNLAAGYLPAVAACATGRVAAWFYDQRATWIAPMLVFETVAGAIDVFVGTSALTLVPVPNVGIALASAEVLVSSGGWQDWLHVR